MLRMYRLEGAGELQSQARSIPNLLGANDLRVRPAAVKVTPHHALTVWRAYGDGDVTALTEGVLGDDEDIRPAGGDVDGLALPAEPDFVVGHPDRETGRLSFVLSSVRAHGLPSTTRCRRFACPLQEPILIPIGAQASGP